MKRFILVMLMLSMVMGLAGCKASEEAQQESALAGETVIGNSQQNAGNSSLPDSEQQAGNDSSSAAPQQQPNSGDTSVPDGDTPVSNNSNGGNTAGSKPNATPNGEQVEDGFSGTADSGKPSVNANGSEIKDVESTAPNPGNNSDSADKTDPNGSTASKPNNPTSKPSDSSASNSGSSAKPNGGAGTEVDPNRQEDDNNATGAKPNGGSGNANQNGASEQPEVEQPEEQKPAEKDYSDYLTIVSYNIKSLKLSLEGVVDVLRQLDGDIVGLQEVDYYSMDTGNVDQTEFLARKLGYNHYYFANCMGNYGTAILSRYPMKITEHTYSDYVGSEVRKYARAEVDVDGKELVFYNTHLTTGTWEQTGIQFKELLKSAYKEKLPTVVAGDFNLTVAEMKKRLYPQLLFALHGGNEMTHKLPAVSYDNIFVRNIDDYYWEILDEETQEGVGIKVWESDASDHNPIYTYIKLP